MNRNLLLIILFINILISNSAEASQIYLNRNESWGGNLTGIFHSSLVFGDINNDGYNDMISSGCTAGDITTCTTAITKVYTNNGTTLTENQTWQQNLTGVGLSSLSLGDIDNDGNLDLVLAGDMGGFDGTIKVYTNNGTVFNENLSWEANLTDISVIGGSVALGDVNNDGRIDLALEGADSSNKNGIYINNGTSFNKDFYWVNNMSLAGQGYGFGVNALGDLNNDGLIDLIFSGSYSTNFYVNVYINNGSSLIENATWRNGLDTWAWPSIILGDYDNDGDMDLAYMGTHGGDRFYIYNNSGNTFIRGQLVGGLFDGSISWGDYNNDGYLDLASMGKEEDRSVIFFNNFTDFLYDSNVNIDFRTDNMQQGSLAWIDLDNDRDLDLACNGNGYGIGLLNKIYISNSTTSNNSPTPPISYFNSTFNFSIGKLTLSWGNGSDVETPTLGLYYNLRVGTCSGCHDVVSGIYGGSSNPTAGYFGNMMQRKRIVLNRPDLENKTIYWAVQTIDTGLGEICVVNGAGISHSTTVHRELDLRCMVFLCQ